MITELVRKHQFVISLGSVLLTLTIIFQFLDNLSIEQCIIILLAVSLSAALNRLALTDWRLKNNQRRLMALVRECSRARLELKNILESRADELSDVEQSARQSVLKAMHKEYLISKAQFQQSPNFELLLDEKGTIVRCNDNLLHLLGQTQAQVGKHDLLNAGLVQLQQKMATAKVEAQLNTQQSCTV